ncbi:MAG: hypothetical protein ACO2ZM_07515 [Francisellaceae bacterium]
MKTLRYFLSLVLFIPLSAWAADSYSVMVEAASGISSALFSAPNDDYPMLYSNGKDQWPFLITVYKNGVALDSSQLDINDFTLNFYYNLNGLYDLFDQPIASDYDDGIGQQLETDDQLIEAGDLNSDDYVVSLATTAATGYAYSPYNSLSLNSSPPKQTTGSGELIYINAYNPDARLSLGAQMWFSVDYTPPGSATSITSNELSISLQNPLDLATEKASDLMKFSNSGLSSPFDGNQFMSDYPHDLITKFSIDPVADKRMTFDISKTFSAISCDNYGGYCSSGNDLHVLGNIEQPYQLFEDSSAVIVPDGSISSDDKTIPLTLYNDGHRELVLMGLSFTDSAGYNYSQPFDVGVKGMQEGGGHTGTKTLDLLLPSAVNTLTQINFSYDGIAYSCEPENGSFSFEDNEVLTFAHYSGAGYEVYKLKQAEDGQWKETGATMCATSAYSNGKALPLPQSASIYKDDGGDYIEALYATNGMNNYNVGCYGEHCRNIGIVADKAKEASGAFYLETGGNNSTDKSSSNIVLTLMVSVVDSMGNQGDIPVNITLDLSSGNYQFTTTNDLSFSPIIN